MSADLLRLRMDGVRPAFAARARYVLETLGHALAKEVVWTDGDADLVYAPERPAHGVWIPADDHAQRFFEHADPFPSRAVHRARGLNLLFAPSHPDEPIPGDIVAGAFYLLARWDDAHIHIRGRDGRLALSASAFGQIAGLDANEPLIETYLAALRAALGLRPPSTWGVALAHVDDDPPLGAGAHLARSLQHGPLAPALRPLIGRNPWDHLADALAITWQRGLRCTVFLPAGETRHARRLVAAVRAAGGEVALSGSPAAAADDRRLANQLALLHPARSAGGLHLPITRASREETLACVEAAGAAYLCEPPGLTTTGFSTGLARAHRPWLLDAERPAELVSAPVAVSDTALWAVCGGDSEAAREHALAVLERVRRAGGRVTLMWRLAALDRAAGPWAALWVDLIDELARRGARLGPIGEAERRPVGRHLDGHRVLHLTTVHRPRDVRIFHKQARALARAGARAAVAAPARPLARTVRPLAGWRLAARAARSGADLFHLHDPELLPVGLWLKHITGKPVVYDVHEYLGQTARTKMWLPAALRRPIAWTAERLERCAARHLTATVTSNEDLAARFSLAGARAVSVANSPWSDSFPEPVPPSGEPVVLYVGGIGPLRGMNLMREAFPQVTVPGARLVLAGPGDPGDLPERVEYLGRVDHSAVPGLLARAAVAWIPLQRHGNYDRAVPTKLIEAMAAGRPVVTSDLGRASAIVRAAGCGIIVPAADAAAHAHALTHLLSNPEVAAKMGEAGRRAFLEGLDFDTEARSLTALYAEILD